jgi:hypothetical protein
MCTVHSQSSGRSFVSTTCTARIIGNFVSLLPRLAFLKLPATLLKEYNPNFDPVANIYTAIQYLHLEKMFQLLQRPAFSEFSPFQSFAKL